MKIKTVIIIAVVYFAVAYVVAKVTMEGTMLPGMTLFNHLKHSLFPTPPPKGSPAYDRANGTNLSGKNP